MDERWEPAVTDKIHIFRIKSWKIQCSGEVEEALPLECSAAIELAESLSCCAEIKEADSGDIEKTLPLECSGVIKTAESSGLGDGSQQPGLLCSGVIEMDEPFTCCAEIKEADPLFCSGEVEQKAPG